MQDVASPACPSTPESTAASEDAMSVLEAASPLMNEDSQSSTGSEKSQDTSGSETSSQTLSRSGTPTLESDDSTLQEVRW